ncbi:MAG: twin-arginine translocase TatA/TatE family subunit [Desulfobacterales bacterium]|nr:twin-arginine translocase TatA/TatE family subunit [Desulfobacterales bacterium]
MFGIGMPEMILILAIALIVIGPKKLPDLAKSLGRAMNEFKKATREIKESIDVDGDLKDVKQSFDDLNADLRDSINPLKSDPVKPPTESPASSDDEPPGSASETSPESTGEGTTKHE